MQKGQVLLGAGALLLVLVLYFAGKTVKKKEPLVSEASNSINFDQYEEIQLNQLSDSLKQQQKVILTNLQGCNKVDTASTKKYNLQLSKFWKDAGNDALGTYYFYQFAQIDNSSDAYQSAGDALVNAYKSTPDSIILKKLITFALQSYELAVQKDGSDIDLKIKLADAYVQGSAEPMKGIGILRHLEDSLPNHIPVLLALGRLAIQSGQYDKAKERFQKILQIQPQNTEAMYFLAITEAELGHDTEAIRLFEMCKILVGNIDFSKEIDEIVKNLKNKKV